MIQDRFDASVRASILACFRMFPRNEPLNDGSVRSSLKSMMPTIVRAQP